MRQVRPTRSQWWMIGFMAMIVVGLIGFAFFEIRGIIDPAPEDTFSEWVFDLPTWANLFISFVSIVLGAILSWSAIHYIVDKNASWRGKLKDQ